jgi:homeobox-leucine zipper protein
VYYLQVAEILKDRPSWYRDCRAVDILNVLPTANGGTIELLYMQVKQLKLSVYES